MKLSFIFGLFSWITVIGYHQTAAQTTTIPSTTVDISYSEQQIDAIVAKLSPADQTALTNAIENLFMQQLNSLANQITSLCVSQINDLGAECENQILEVGLNCAQSSGSPSRRIKYAETKDSRASLRNLDDILGDESQSSDSTSRRLIKLFRESRMNLDDILGDELQTNKEEYKRTNLKSRAHGPAGPPGLPEQRGLDDILGDELQANKEEYKRTNLKSRKMKGPSGGQRGLSESEGQPELRGKPGRRVRSEPEGPPFR